MKTLIPKPLTATAFAPFGDVLEMQGPAADQMNAGDFARYSNLAKIDLQPAGEAAINLVVSRNAVSLPYPITMLERHPLGSQAFVPLDGQVFVVVVADAATGDSLQAFFTDGRQGINYFRGTWHMPLIALAADQRFLLIERSAGAGSNCETRPLTANIMLDRIPEHD